MSKCTNCNAKIGFFQEKHKLQDGNGNKVCYCSQCFKEWESENKKKLEKEKLEQEKQDNQNKQIISELCSKYLQNKDNSFKSITLGIYNNSEFLDLIRQDELDSLINYFSELLQNTKNSTLSNTEDFDSKMLLESQCNTALELFHDLKKLKKLFYSKNIDSNYLKIFDEIAVLVKGDLYSVYDDVITRLYNTISKISKTDKKKIIREYLNINNDNSIDETNVILIKKLLDKFGLEYSDSEIPNLLQESVEEKELEKFENNLGFKKHKQIGNYENLNGNQFEEYLKTLFSLLGYHAKCTKKSGDQGADLIIMKDNEKTVVQAKKYSKPVTNTAIQEVVASRKYYNSNKAMVVTTSSFTKSALELAKSNDVELWDKNKLNSIIEKINNSSSQTDYSTEQKINLDENVFPMLCPYCNNKFFIELEDLPEKGSNKKIICSECKMDLIISLKKEQYMCPLCKTDFETMKEKVIHTKSCPQMQARRFDCKFCKKAFYLDDNEFQELTKNGKIEVNCPICNKINYLKK